MIFLFGIQAHQLAGQEPLATIVGLVHVDSSNEVVPYAAIQVKGTNRGTYSAANGFFSVVASPGDTLVARSLGFYKSYVPVPDTIENGMTIVIISMVRDTMSLEEVVVYPWPSKAQFREAFLALNIKDTHSFQMGPLPGIKQVENPVPIKPNPIMNPASFLYEEILLKLLDRLPKRKRVKELPKWE